MKNNKLLIGLCLAVALLILPIVIRYTSYYQGSYQPAKTIATPDYAGLKLPEPPISTPAAVTVTAQSDKTIILDQYHGNLFSIDELALLLQPLEERGVTIERYDMYTMTSLEEKLKYADAYVVIAPTTDFSVYEVQAVKEFVDRGGRLLVLTDPTRSYSYNYYDPYSGSMPYAGLASANTLLEPYKLAFNNDYLYNVKNNEGNFRNIIFTSFGESPVTKGLSKVVLYSANSLRRVESPLIKGDADTLSSNTDTGGDLAAAGMGADGKVVAIGDMTFLSTPYITVADNQVLVGNLVDFLLGGERVPGLADFPYIFTQPVDVVTTTVEIKINSEMLGAFASLQASLEGRGLSMAYATESVKGHDLIVLGTYSATDTIQPYLDAFGITIPTSTETEDGGFDFNDPFSALPTPEPELTPTPTPLPAGDAGTEIFPTPTPYVDWGYNSSNSGYDTWGYDYGYNSDYGDTGAKVITLTIAGFGDVEAPGVGLLLLKISPERTTLVLLAEDAASLTSLLSRLQSGDLSGCMRLEKMAICSLGYYSSSYDSYGTSY
ncbi:MAG TPA: Gldg family protein [Anaerolineaceae bacterium]|nr:Gldg family protein [Anaerolineaceae bacterium]HPN50556.1 Gldg family protein [Anaerolineaceae bacterium]